MSPHVSSNVQVPFLYLLPFLTNANPSIPIFRTIQTAVLIETLTALGAEVTWSSCVRIRIPVSSMTNVLTFPRSFRTFSPLRIMLLLRKLLFFVTMQHHLKYAYRPQSGLPRPAFQSLLGRERPRRNTFGVSNNPSPLSPTANL